MKLKMIKDLAGAMFFFVGLGFIIMSLIYGDCFYCTFEQAGKSFFSLMLGFTLLFSSFIFLIEEI